MERNQDRALLGTIAVMSLLVLAGVAFGVIIKDDLGEAPVTILATIVGGLLVNSKDVIAAIKEAWNHRQFAQMSDKLGDSAPIDNNRKPTGEPGNPVHVVEEGKTDG